MIQVNPTGSLTLYNKQPALCCVADSFKKLFWYISVGQIINTCLYELFYSQNNRYYNASEIFAIPPEPACICYVNFFSCIFLNSKRTNPIAHNSAILQFTTQFRQNMREYQKPNCIRSHIHGQWNRAIAQNK